jgi:putative hemolysin
MMQGGSAEPALAVQQATSEAGAAREPDPSAALVLTVSVLTALTVSFLCSLFEGVLLSVSASHAEGMARRGSRVGRILRRWKKTDIEVPIAAILLVNTTAHTFGALYAGSSYADVFGPGTVGLFSIGFTVAMLVFTEIIPKTLGVLHAARLAAPVTVAVEIMVVSLKPLLWITTRISRWLTRGQEQPPTTIEEIRLLAALGQQQGAVGARLAAFIEGVTNLRELEVHDVMVPRGGVAFLSAARPLADNLEVIRASGHSRFLFTRDDDLDHVEGIVLAKEVLFMAHDLGEGASADWDKLVTPLVVVPPSKSLDEVLRLFQEKRKHMAVVVDEFGGTLGVVTLEDVLEEIVGEIEDETDRVEQLIEKRPDGSIVCRGWAEMRKVFKVLGVEERVEFVTIGGFVADRLGRVPVAGDEVRYKRLVFRVTKASARRAERVEVFPAPPEPEGDDSEGDRPSEEGLIE